MIKIATHDSVTGEKPKNFFSWLMIPFSRTQVKTIKEQYAAGCRMFDIRCRLCEDGLFHGAHGLFITKRALYDFLEEINSFEESCYVSVTYEGILRNTLHKYQFISFIQRCKLYFKHIKWGAISAKYKSTGTIKVEYDHIEPAQQWDRTRQGFVPLDGKTWQTYIPIPWLWKKIYYNKPKFDEEVFTFVDFL